MLATAASVGARAWRLGDPLLARVSARVPGVSALVRAAPAPRPPAPRRFVATRAGASPASPAPPRRDRAPRDPRTRGSRGGRGGRGGPRRASPAVKRRARQFTDEQRAKIAALQALADAGAAPVCALAKGKANIFLDGNPIVYGGAVADVRGDPAPADPVIVVDHAGAVVAWGVYNPDSMYRVRVLEMAWEVTTAPSPAQRSASSAAAPAVRADVDAVVTRRIAEAATLRDTLGLLADPDTTTYRLVNAEGDRLSGVCVDVYGDAEEDRDPANPANPANPAKERGLVTAVASVSALWATKHRGAIVAALGSCAARVDRVVWRADAKMLALETGGKPWVGDRDEGAAEGGGDDASGDGFGEDALDGSGVEDGLDGSGVEDGFDGSGVTDRDLGGARLFDAKTGEELAMPPSLSVVVKERGVTFRVDLRNGHKTGFYVDQRANRAWVRAMSAGKSKILDVCTYTGGFAINAALGGAASVVGIDSSRAALDVAEENARRNGVADRCAFERADAFEALDERLTRGEAGTYDAIVLDPPKFAPNVGALPRATPKYVGLNARAMQLLKPGGVLVTCSCSGAVTQRGLLPDVVDAAAASAGKRVTSLGAPRGAGEDQPLDSAFPEGNYLSVCVVRVG